MIDEHKLLRDNSAAVGAQALLENELLKSAFQSLKDQYTADLLNSKADQTAARETLYLAHRVVVEVERHLSQIIINGRLAAAELTNLTQLADRKRKFGTI